MHLPLFACPSWLLISILPFPSLYKQLLCYRTLASTASLPQLRRVLLQDVVDPCVLCRWGGYDSWSMQCIGIARTVLSVC